MNATPGMPELIALIEHTAADHAGSVIHFVDDAGSTETVTVSALVDRAKEIAASLRQLGLQRRDVVAIRASGGSRGAAEAIVACLVGGFVAVPLVSLLGDGDVDLIIEIIDARALLAERSIRGRDLTEHLAGVRDASTERVVGGIGTLEGDEEFALPRGDWAPPSWAGIDADDVATILFSSGTTGQPKGVMHSYSSVLHEVRDFADQLELTHGGCFMQTFPIGHIGGVAGLLIGVALGRETVMLSSWNAPVAFDAIDRHRVTGMGSTPYFAQTLLDERESRGSGLTSLRAVQSGGGAVGEELVKRAHDLGIPISRGYGSTEHPSATTHRPDDPLEIRATTDGRPFNGTEVRIVDASGIDCPTGAVGEVWLRGPEQFIGYVSDAVEGLRDDGWFTTGDLGRMTESGHLVITGRLKEIIIRGGENISVPEVEGLLLKHPAIRDAAVVGVADVKFGERAHAYLVVEPGTAVDLETVRAHFAELGVARYKTPEFVTVIDGMPRNSLGKIQKHLLPRRREGLTS
ncbi:MAG: AMP-binding protein [Cryobacterium sp.]|nr:AMP-binding protein [Cryobacterium sp.]